MKEPSDCNWCLGRGYDSDTGRFCIRCDGKGKIVKKMTFRRRINVLMKKKKISFMDIYKDSGCSKGWCWKMVNDDYANPSLESLLRISDVFDLTVSQLLKDVEE